MERIVGGEKSKPRQILHQTRLDRWAVEGLAKRRRKSIILRLTLLAFSIYTIISMSRMEMELVEARRQLTDIENQKTEQELKNQELLQLLENGSEKDFIERAARDRLGYVYADEKVYTDMSGMAGS